MAAAPAASHCRALSSQLHLGSTVYDETVDSMAMSLLMGFLLLYVDSLTRCYVLWIRYLTVLLAKLCISSSLGSNFDLKSPWFLTFT